MKRTRPKYGLLWVLPALLLLFWGWKAYSGHEGVTQIIQRATATAGDETGVPWVPPVVGKTVLVESKYQARPFWTEGRKDKMERFQCSQCHNNREVKVLRAAEVAHGDIRLVHGGKDKPLSCFTCHKKDERDFLVTEKGVKVDMDHSYRMCGQCHFRQNRDWVGGAHGKRVSYWAGKRVVKNCTSCHDPHSPRFEKRWPRTYSRPLTR